MKTINIILIIGIVLLISMVGCRADAQPTTAQQQQPYIGGGCGVASIDSDEDNINQLPVERRL